ncbi:hypothetical protein ANCCAN_17410, partial [Ancylostoma caninum]
LRYLFPDLCPSSYDVTSSEPVRRKFLDLSNKYRSQVAQGKIRMGNGRMTPEAASMTRLEYSCEMETSANRIAYLCNDSDSNTQDVVEIRKILRNRTINPVAAAEQKYAVIPEQEICLQGSVFF